MRPDLTFRSLWRQYRQDKFAKELAIIYGGEGDAR